MNPPIAASAAFVAATPLRLDIAVPVEAVPSSITADDVAPAAAIPPAVPTAAPPNPPRITPAPTETFFNSSLSYSGNFTPSLLYSLNCGLF